MPTYSSATLRLQEACECTERSFREALAGLCEASSAALRNLEPEDRHDMATDLHGLACTTGHIAQQIAATAVLIGGPDWVASITDEEEEE